MLIKGIQREIYCNLGKSIWWFDFVLLSAVVRHMAARINAALVQGPDSAQLRNTADCKSTGKRKISWVKCHSRRQYSMQP